MGNWGCNPYKYPISGVITLLIPSDLPTLYRSSSIHSPKKNLSLRPMWRDLVLDPGRGGMVDQICGHTVGFGLPSCILAVLLMEEIRLTS